MLIEAGSVGKHGGVALTWKPSAAALGGKKSGAQQFKKSTASLECSLYFKKKQSEGKSERLR